MGAPKRRLYRASENSEGFGAGSGIAGHYLPVVAPLKPLRMPRCAAKYLHISRAKLLVLDGVTAIPLEVVSKAWRRHVFRDDGAIDFYAYTFCALQQLQTALERRAVFVEGSWLRPIRAQVCSKARNGKLPGRSYARRIRCCLDKSLWFLVRLPRSVGPVRRKPPIVVGLLIYFLGSVACAFAWTAPLLIGARVVQAYGAAAGQLSVEQFYAISTPALTSHRRSRSSPPLSLSPPCWGRCLADICKSRSGGDLPLSSSRFAERSCSPAFSSRFQRAVRT